MPTEIYEKVVGDDGVETYQPVDWSKAEVEIPDEVVRKTGAYKKTLDESVNRRNRIKALQEQLAKLETEEGEPEQKPTQPEPEGLNFKTRQELLDFIQNETKQRDSASAQAKRDKEAKVTEIVNKHKLSSDAINILMGLEIEQAETMAQYIGQQKLRFDDAKGGISEQRQLSVDSIAAKVAGKLNLSDEK
jgi:hypothetical protein